MIHLIIFLYEHFSAGAQQLSFLKNFSPVTQIDKWIITYNIGA